MLNAPEAPCGDSTLLRVCGEILGGGLGIERQVGGGRERSEEAIQEGHCGSRHDR